MRGRDGSDGSRTAVLFLAAAGLLFFAPFAPFAGLHLDDHGFIEAFAFADVRALWRMTVEYVPGRNLYIPYFYLLYKSCAGSAPAMHVFGLLLDLLNPILLFFLACRLGAGRGRALAAAGIFLVWPSHGETHWWTSAIMMNLFSTTLTLAAFLAAGATGLPRGARLALAAVLYIAALFDYDQVFFLWLPLLAFVRWADPKMRRRDLVVAAAVFAALNALHLAARLFWPWSSGGRPVPRFDVFLSSLRIALTHTLLPVHRLPRLDGSPWGWAAAAALAVGAGVLWLNTCARGWDVPAAERERAEWRMASFGALWWLLAYLPNFFWYISPRHNYLPSAGVALAAAALWSRGASFPRLRRPLAAVAALTFALCGVCAWAGGRSWAESSALQERFVASVQPLPDGAAGMFLIGAPKSIGEAPGFMFPQEPLRSLRRASARPAPEAGDISISAGRRSLFYGGQAALFGDDVAPAFIAPGRSVVFQFSDDGRFERVCALRLTMPGMMGQDVPLQGPCPGVRVVAAPALLLSSRRVPGERADRDEAVLESAALRDGPEGTLDLRLSWKAGRIPADFAFYVRLLGADGRELYRSSYAPSSREHEALWPLYDDINPAVAWRSGDAVTQVFRLRPRRPLEGRPAKVRAALFSPRGVPQWTPAGFVEASLEPS